MGLLFVCPPRFSAIVYNYNLKNYLNFQIIKTSHRLIVAPEKYKSHLKPISSKNPSEICLHFLMDNYIYNVGASVHGARLLT